MEMEDWRAMSATMIKNWPNTRWDEANVMVYFRHLEAHDAAAVFAAMELCVEEGREFFPPCPVIIAKINQISDHQEKVPSWPDALTWFRRAGGCGDAARAERLLREKGMTLVWQFVLSFGYRECCLSEVDDPDNGVHERRRVQMAWEAFIRNEREGFAIERALGRGDGIRHTSFLERYEQRHLELHEGGAA